MTAGLTSTGSATNDAPASTIVLATDAIPATQGPGKVDDTAGGLDIGFAVRLFLALSALSGLVLWGWSRGRTPTAASAIR